MANVYDIARIKSGDPMGRAFDKGRYASTELNKYRHQAEIVEAYNEALKEAEEASKKGKLFGIGGNLLGGLLSAGGNMLFPGLGNILGPMGAGIGAGVEKKQDKISMMHQEP